MNNDVILLLNEFIDLSELLKNDNIFKSNKIVVDLFFSNKCNLNCKHCYFGNTININSPLNFDEWTKTVDSLYEGGIRHFHISGKESALEPHSRDLVYYIKNKADTYCGVVTNGTGPNTYYENLVISNIDYIEFSIDGLEHQHNYIRGKDIFSATVKTISDIVRISSTNTINITSTLNNKNWTEYISIISFFTEIGIKRFFAAPFLEKGNGSLIHDLLLSSQQFSQLIEDTFSFLKSTKETGVVIKYCIPHHLIVPMSNENPVIKEIIRKYLLGENDLIFRINGNIIQLSFSFIELDYLNMLIITNDGYVLPCADDISCPNYSNFALGNIRRDSIKEIFEKRQNLIKQEIAKHSFNL